MLKKETQSKSQTDKLEIKTNSPKAKKFSDLDLNDIKILLYGPYQSGKTYTIGELLELGLKILYFSTDAGGSGLLTIRNYLRKKDRRDLEENLIVFESKHIDTYDKLLNFLQRPDKYVEGLYDLDIDLVFWDGFSNFQADHVHNKVTENVNAAAAERDKDITAAREAGMQFETQDWGQVKAATQKAANLFWKMHNKKTGQVWHKIITCQTSATSKAVSQGSGSTTSIVEVKKPQISGQAALSILAACDLIIYTGFKKSPVGGKKDYFYITSADDETVSKSRGFDLLDKEEASMSKLWGKLTTQTGITTKAFDQSLIEEVEEE